MKITKLFALVAFIGLFAVGCSNDDNDVVKPPQKGQEVEKEIGTKLPIVGEYAFNHGPVGSFPVVFGETTYKGLGEDIQSNVIKVILNTKEDIYKVILKSPEPNKDGNQIRALFLRNVTVEQLDVHQDYYFKTEKEAIDSKYPPKDDGVGAGHGHGGDDEKYGWIPVKKVGAPEVKLELLNGKYGSEILLNAEDSPLAQYLFVIGEEDEAFLFKANMGNGFKESSSLSLKRVHSDEDKGQLIYEIKDSKGYYEGREGQFLTVYVKDISESGDKATFAIATKGGVNSISTSKGDVIGKTLEEAKAIEAPAADAEWGKNMMKYAHLWISTTKE